MTAQLTQSQARRIALAAQGFGRARPASGVSMRQLQSQIDRLAQLQIDSVNVAVRAHLMPVFSRLGAYDPALLDRAAGRSPRRLFEYWGHAASLIDVELQPALRFRMHAADRSEPWERVRQIEHQHPGLIDRVLQEITTRGALTARQVEHQEVRDRTHWGWNWSSVKIALEWHFLCGRLSVAQRNAQFERVYDLPDRVLPPAVRRMRTPTADEAHVILARHAARALGVMSDRCLADYFRTKLAPTRAAIAVLLEQGELIPVTVAGWSRAAYMWHDARIPRQLHAAALVSPFDSLIFERARAADLFGIDYRIEIYVPAEQRRFGYYVYPFLLDEGFAARVDIKADRQRGVLLVASAWLEPACQQPVARVAGELAASLSEMAQWLGLSAIAVSDIGTLSRELADAVRVVG